MVAGELATAEEEALAVVAACAEETALLTVTVLVKVVVVILVDVAGTQLVARRNTPRCPELDCAIECVIGSTFCSSICSVTYRRSSFYPYVYSAEDCQNHQGDGEPRRDEHDESTMLCIEISR